MARLVVRVGGVNGFGYRTLIRKNTSRSVKLDERNSTNYSIGAPEIEIQKTKQTNKQKKKLSTTDLGGKQDLK